MSSPEHGASPAHGPWDSPAWRQFLLVGGVLLSVELLAVWPLLKAGLPGTSDLMFHLLRAVELEPLLRSGWLYPRWAPDFILGYGSPIFNYYAPLGTYLLAGLHLLGLAYPIAAKIAHLGIFLSYGPAMYVFARRFAGPVAATVAAAAYVYVPFHLHELYWQGDIPQHLAFALLPLAFAAVHILITQPSLRSFLATMLLTAALVLAHNITAFTSGVFLALYAVLLAATWGWRRLLPVVLGALAAALLTTFFWLPALAERSLVQLERLTQNFFNYRGHFVTLWDLFAPVPPADRSLEVNIFRHDLGIPQVVFSLLTLPGFARFRRMEPNRRVHLVFGWITLVAAVLLMLPVSEPLWAHLPLLEYVEFPWRFQALAGLATAVLAALATEWIYARLPARLRPLAYIAAILLILVPSLVRLYPREPLEAYDVRSTADILPFELKTGVMGTAAGAEYFTRWVQQRPGLSADAGRLDPASLPPQATARLEDLSGLSQVYTLDLPTSAQAIFNVFYFPGWQATLDGAPLALSPREPTGLITAILPAGQHQLELSYQGSPVERAAEFASLLCAGLIALVAGRWWWQRSGSASGAQARPCRCSLPGRQALGVMLSALVVLGLQRGLLDSTTVLSYASPPGRALEAQFPADQLLGDRVRFLGYDLSAPAVYSGDELRLTLYWQSVVPLSGEYHSFVKLMRRSTGEVIAQTDHQDPGGIPAFGWHTERLERDEHVLTIPAGAPPMDYQILAGLYTMPGTRPLRAGAGNSGLDALTIGQVVVRGQPLPAGRIARTIGWTADNGIHLLGYSLDPQTARAGQSLHLHLFWQADRAVAGDYTVFVHLLDASGQLVTTADGPPVQGDYRTSEWVPGDTVDDEHDIAIPATLPAGAYRLQVGLYDPGTEQRVAGKTSAGQATQEILLDPPLTIQP